MIGLIVLDHSKNFWEVNPDFKMLNPYKTLYEMDKDKKKNPSSTMMWFVVYSWYPLSIFHKMDVVDKYTLIGEDYCGDREYYKENRSTIDMLTDAFCKHCLTAIQRQMKAWDELLDKRTRFINEQEYTFETGAELDKMAIGTDKVFATLKKIQDDLSKEDNSGTAKGGSRPSLND